MRHMLVATHLEFLMSPSVNIIRFHDMLDRLCASGKIDTKQKAALANACDFVGHCSASVRAHCLNTVQAPLSPCACFPAGWATQQLAAGRCF